jgi:hypothetical protein
MPIGIMVTETVAPQLILLIIKFCDGLLCPIVIEPSSESGLNYPENLMEFGRIDFILSQIIQA